MTDIAAALGLAQFKRYPAMLDRRRAIIEKYDGAFKSQGIKTLTHYCENYRSSGHLYITRIPDINEEKRNEIIAKMAERGVACNVHYKPLPLLSAYKNLGFNIKDYPNAYKNYENERTLPLYTSLTDEQIEYVIQSCLETVREYL